MISWADRNDDTSGTPQQDIPDRDSGEVMQFLSMVRELARLIRLEEPLSRLEHMALVVLGGNIQRLLKLGTSPFLDPNQPREYRNPIFAGDKELARSLETLARLLEHKEPGLWTWRNLYHGVCQDVLNRFEFYDTALSDAHRATVYMAQDQSERIQELEQQITDWQAATSLQGSSGDPASITPGDLERLIRSQKSAITALRRLIPGLEPDNDVLQDATPEQKRFFAQRALGNLPAEER